MGKNINKTPSRTNKSISTINKRNKFSGKISTRKNIEKKRNKGTIPTERKNKRPITKLKISKKEYSDKSKTVIRKWEKASQSIQPENVQKTTQNHKKTFQDIQVENNKPATQNWKNVSQNMLVDNILIGFNKNKHIEGNMKDKKQMDKDSIKNLKDKQKKWFNDLKQSMKNSLKSFNEAQKKALDNLEKAILDKLSSKNKEDEFLKETLLILLAHNAFSKDLQNLGQVNVSTTERESYL